MNQDIEKIRAGFGNLSSMDPEGPTYAKLIALLDRCDDEAIVAAKDANIKFVSRLALNRCVRRGLV